MFLASKNFLQKTLPEIAAAGATLAVEGCINKTLDWVLHCEAMKSMCGSSVPRVMITCLKAADRTTECSNLMQGLHSTHFGYSECKARELNRSMKAACAASYRALDNYCTEKTQSIKQ